MVVLKENQKVNRFMFSTIAKKKCKCSEDCDKWPTLGYMGFNYAHASQEIKDKVGTKTAVARKNKNKRNALSRKLHVAQNQVSGAELQRWFEERREEMVGTCSNCGKKSCKENDDFFRFSIAHILPKAYFPSVKTHDKNWLELCFWGENSCHTNLDHMSLDLIDLNCFDEVVTKFVSIYPSIAEHEKKRIPQVLLQYIETEK